MEQNNGRGIFYGVIGVATLVVAIIGATFAYFSSQNNTADDAIQTGTATVANYTLEADETVNTKTGLIPVKSSDANFAKHIGTSATSCLDDSANKYPMCTVYTYTIGNESNVAQETYVTLKPSALSKFTNLHYAIYDGKPADGTFSTPDNALATDTFTGTDPISLTSALGTSGVFTLGAKGTGTATKTFTIVLWLEEAGAANNAEIGGTFAAGLTVSNSATGNTGITAVLTA